MGRLEPRGNRMSHASRLAVIPCVLWAGALAGCTSQTGTTRYEGNAVTQPMPFTAGTDITIASANGNIAVDTAGLANEISAVGVPFALGADDDAGKKTAMAAMQSGLALSIAP